MNNKGYGVNEHALEIIGLCNAWYANREVDDFHVRRNLNDKECHLSRMNFAKRCCADDANLCEVISVAPEKKTKAKKFIEELLRNNSFDIRYREQLEKTSANGTVGAYINLKNAKYIKSDGNTIVKGGDIRINYVDADCIVPLTVENKHITEVAFASTSKVKGKEQTMLIIFTLDDHGMYVAETVVFNHEGEKEKELCFELQLGNVKPFAIMQTAEVNNLDNMEGYGLPKVYNSIPFFKAIDLCYNILYGDLDKGEKVLFINELLACLKIKDDGEATLTPRQKDLFILLGEKLPDEKSIIHEYNPEIRVEQITKAFELVLSLLSMYFGYGTKKYSFENGRIVTATEYAGTKQDTMQELNKQRKQATDYISDIIHAAMWFSNQFCGTSYNLEEALSIEFDDSYVEDKASKLEAMRADALSFPEVPWLKLHYLMEKYNLTEEEAKRYIGDIEEPEDDLED